MSRAAVQRVEAAYRRIEARERPEAWITLRQREDVLAEAVALSDDAGPLVGQLLAIKDNIDVAGLPTTAAHPEFARVADRDAPAVARLRAAGALVLGKTNMDQFATGLVGTRSPYGAVRSAVSPDLVAGGSSSGSAVVVALGIADISLGTDTAGSGRVPAAFNNIVGLKPSRGLISLSGVVPAARSFDCVSVFARNLADAVVAANVAIGPDGQDPASMSWPATARLEAPDRPVIAVPDSATTGALPEPVRSAFEDVVAAAGQVGEVVSVDFAPFAEAARLLYEGGFVAERFEAFGDFFDTHPEYADRDVRAVIDRAREVRGAQVFHDQHRLAMLRRQAELALGDADVLLVPTTTYQPTIAEALADPDINTELGRFTNFVNLFGMAAVAVPWPSAGDRPFGVTVLARGFDDCVAIDVSARLVGQDTPNLSVPGVPVAVFGAHMSGHPLNAELRATGARLVGALQTSPDYELFALPGTPSLPGLAPGRGNGGAISGEEWLIPPGRLSELAEVVRPPLSLGPVSLADGRSIQGFLTSVREGEEITQYGGWRRYLAAKSAAQNMLQSDGESNCNSQCI
ncbi:allophanate hydrolase [Streptomyces massasporeus]|uniref:allophanate hydrolase n=1 Tax=Streptomyces massasporeus TaxID=67324 RepID=UPI003679D4F7